MEVKLVQADRLSLAALARLWNEAFRDYYVPMQLTTERYAVLVRRELISLPDSFVAFVNGQAVGFALAGLRRQGDQMLGYDAGTAVIAAYRQRGIARQLMQAMLQRLADLGAWRVTLTAVSANQPAIALYQRLGFQVLRQLSCWERTGGSDVQSAVPAGLALEPIDPGEVVFLQLACYRQMPEWQNWPDGEKLLKAEALLANWQGQPVGYALFAGRDPLYLYQLGVLPDWRRRGVGRALLQALTERAHRNVIYLNHPEEEQEAAACLEKVGFTVFLRQVEMGINQGERLLFEAASQEERQDAVIASIDGIKED